MSIFPLPVFEADADPRHRDAMTDEEIYERLEPPRTIVVKFGYMKLVAEYPYDGDAKPGCGSKLVARTHRGTEVVEMLTTTCANAGCGKSVTRQEMMEFISNSGGKDYPFHEKGKILRVATTDDVNGQSALDSNKPEYIRTCKRLISELNLPMKLVEVELILGQELLTFYFLAQDRVDFRELVRQLAAEFKTRIEMRQVGARDEARLVADYERCGQHCCCKSFLKVLKPVSMKLAKVQKGTLDPLKISGRCGRLMCCLRYEDQTYRELKDKLPKRNTRVGTSEGPGIVVDTKILVQLVLVRLDGKESEIAVPVEELMDPDQSPVPAESEASPEPERHPDPLRGLSTEEVSDRIEGRQRPQRPRDRSRPTATGRQTEFRRRVKTEGPPQAIPPQAEPSDEARASAAPKKKHRRQRGRRRRGPPDDSSRPATRGSDP